MTQAGNGVRKMKLMEAVDYSRSGGFVKMSAWPESMIMGFKHPTTRDDTLDTLTVWYADGKGRLSSSPFQISYSTHSPKHEYAAADIVKFRSLLLATT